MLYTMNLLEKYYHSWKCSDRAWRWLWAHAFSPLRVSWRLGAREHLDDTYLMIVINKRFENLLSLYCGCQGVCINDSSSSIVCAVA